VLVVDDEDDIRNSLVRLLGQRGMRVRAVASGEAALGVLAQETFDVILSDVHMPGIDGYELLQRVRGRYGAQVVMMTGTADVATTVSVFKNGAYGFLTKPFASGDTVASEILNAADYGRLRASTPPAAPRAAETTNLLGRSPKMQEVERQIARVAPTSSTVLILGESGTGKELVARALHDRSRRADKPFVTVNCAAIPAELIESELFGHVRGAFTNAAGARAGLFDTANGGTILLDEIGDLDKSAQVKLLRTLQNGEVKPVGSDTSKIVDVRVIAATNVELRAAAAAGLFRQDLFYRLDVVTIQLPPLRERTDDVLLLARHFIERYARLAGRSAPTLMPDAAHCLERYAWPGNVRELEHAIEHAVVLSDGSSLDASSLPSEVRRASTETAHSAAFVDDGAGRGHTPAGSTMLDAVGSLQLDGMTYAEAKKRLLAEFNDAYVFSLLKATQGNVSEAARRAGVDRSNFRRLMRGTSFADVRWTNNDDD
jgi:DNA-binding NtrC family response regulator